MLAHGNWKVKKSREMKCAKCADQMTANLNFRAVIYVWQLGCAERYISYIVCRLIMCVRQKSIGPTRRPTDRNDPPVCSSNAERTSHKMAWFSRHCEPDSVFLLHQIGYLYSAKRKSSDFQRTTHMLRVTVIKYRYLHVCLEYLYGIWSRLCGCFPSALNTWSKVWPWILIWAYLIWHFAPIFVQQISVLDPPLHWAFWSVLVWTFILWVNCGGGVGLGHVRFLSRTETWLLESRLLAAMCERRD